MNLPELKTLPTQEGVLKLTRRIAKLEKYNFDLAVESENKSAEISELRAQVEQLRQLGAELLNQCEGLDLSDAIWEAASNAFEFVTYQDAADNLSNGINKTPAQCLVEVKAQAGREGFIAGYEACENHCNMEHFANEYANQLRQSAKDGSQ